MSSDSLGHISPSVYETARLVTLAPWLTGHTERLWFLVKSQHRNGAWGDGDDGYRLVPTLSATEALLTVSRRDRDVDEITRAAVLEAAERGLRVLLGWLNTERGISVPDTVAVEILVPALVTDINTHMDELEWCARPRLALPNGTDGELLARLRDTVRQGRALPAKLAHSLEIIGQPLANLPWIQPAEGAVGCSPAATAAWLGETTPGDRRSSVGYLAAMQDRHGGPVPVCGPVPVFERSWVIAALTSAGVWVAIPDRVVDSLDAAFGELGVAVGPGLPPDADDTAIALYALTGTARARSPDCLLAYRIGEHFSSFPSERTWSTSTNAHVLQAFGTHDNARPTRYLDTIRRLAGWLCEHQDEHGWWTDKWHASPYYATAGCAVALARHGGSAADGTVHKAVAWVLDSQRADGSWGRWQGTAEETAYAMRVLLHTGKHPVGDAVVRAAARGCAFLLRSEASAHPPLWHDKDLYTPTRVVQAEVIAALWLAHANPRVAALVERDGGDGGGGGGLT
ncbi:MAG TPA: prenyltransferase [Pseudonocardiaceae bacterium]|nr:prenyltransferase [Pseudonocardiaceae bacterium]